MIRDSKGDSTLTATVTSLSVNLIGDDALIDSLLEAVSEGWWGLPLDRERYPALLLIQLSLFRKLIK